jgi:hypothetical protein
MKFRKDMKVKTIEDHDYLRITRRQVGVVTSVSDSCGVEVKFRNHKTVILFQPSELKRAKRSYL